MCHPAKPRPPLLQWLTLANPLRFSATPVRYDLPPPALGEHTQEVLSGLLGMSDEAIAALPRGR